MKETALTALMAMVFIEFLASGEHHVTLGCNVL